MANNCTIPFPQDASASHFEMKAMGPGTDTGDGTTGYTDGDETDPSEGDDSGGDGGSSGPSLGWTLFGVFVGLGVVAGVVSAAGVNVLAPFEDEPSR